MLGCPNYTITSGGIIRNRFGREVRVYIRKRQPEVIILTLGHVRRHVAVARAVMKVFAPVDDMDHLQVHHKDKNLFNNSVENLQWVTPKEHKKIHENEKKSVD